MKLLLDSCVWGGTRHSLHQAGHDVVWSGEWERDPGDEEILEIARSEERILIALDKDQDFDELAVVRGLPHCGIVRLANFGARQQASVILHILENHKDELMQGALVTAEPGRLRVRPAGGNISSLAP